MPSGNDRFVMWFACKRWLDRSKLYSKIFYYPVFMEPLQMFPMLCKLVPLSTYSSLSWGWNRHKRIQIFRLGEWEFSISLLWASAFWILSNVGVFAWICGSRDELCSLTLAQVFISTPKIMSECYAVLPKCFQYLFSTLSPVDRDLIILCATDNKIIKLFVFS